MIDNRTVLHTSLTAILETIGRQPLTDLLFTPIAPEELDWYLAQLSDVAAPAYLPFADSNSQVLALHLHPARRIEQSPVVYLDPDTQRIQFVCADLTRLPTGLWLWMARYFKDRPDDLRQATAMPSPWARWRLANIRVS